MKIWIYLVAFVIILTLFALVGMQTKITNKYKDWCEETMISCDYSPPRLIILEGNKNIIKKSEFTYYIYVKHPKDDSDIEQTKMKKSLIYMLSYIVSDFKMDAKYYSAIDKMMEYGCVDRTIKIV